MNTLVLNLNRRVFERTLITASAMVIFMTHSTVHAGNTWDGGGGDNNWGTGNNWNPDGSPAPGSGNDIFFGGSTRLSPFNNYTSFDDWRNITFNAGAGSFNLFGNAIDLFGKIENLSSNSQSVSLLSVALNSSTANEFNPVNGNLSILSTNVFTNGNQLRVFGNNGFSLSFSSASNIQQAGSLSINQNSTVIFNSAHSYTGDTFINAGKLQFASGGSAANTTIRIGDTSGIVGAEFNLTAASGGQSVANTIVSRLGGAGHAARVIDSQNTSGTNALTGVIALDAALTIRQASGGILNLTGSFFDVKQQVLTVDTPGTVDISKPLNSSFAAGGSLIKRGNGTLTLSNTSNNYTGTSSSSLSANGTQINAGTLAIAADTSLGLAPAGAYNNVQFTGSGTLRSNGNISLHANRNISVASGATATLDSNGNTFTVNGIINGSGGAVTKVGAGTVILTASGSYTGATHVNEGALRMGDAASDTFASNSVTLASGATLGGSGTISGTLGVSGNLAPGGSGVDIQTLAAGTTTWNGGSNLWNFDLSATAGSSDRLAITGDFNKGTAGLFRFDFMSSAPTVYGSVYTLVTWTGSTNFLASDFSFQGLTGANSGSNSFFTLDTTARTLTFTAVPEPTSALAGLLISAGLLRRRRA